MSIKAVLFDLGDTLIGTSLSAFETFQKILEHEGIYVSVEAVEKAFAVAKEELGNVFEELIGKMPSSEFYHMWDSHVLKALDIEDNGDLAREINKQWMDMSGITIFPDAKPTLTVLRGKGIKTGIVSNAYQEEIQQICEMVSLDDFDIVVGSDTAQKAKPDPEIFLYALRELGIIPGEAMYVGNDLEKDYRGAEEAGMIPLLVVREDTKVSEPVKYIGGLMDLTDYVINS